MAAMNTPSSAAGKPAVSPGKRRVAAAAASAPTPAPATPTATAVAAAAAPGVRQSSKKKRRGRELDARTPTPTPTPMRVDSSSTPATAGVAPTVDAPAVAAGTPPPAKKARILVRRGSAARSAARAAGVAAVAAAARGAAVGGGASGDPQPSAAGSMAGDAAGAEAGAVPKATAVPAVAAADAAAPAAVPGGGEGVAKPRGRGGKRHQAAKERRAAAQARDAAASAAAAARRRADSGGDDLADNLDLPQADVAAGEVTAAPGAVRKAKRKALKEANKAKPSSGHGARAAAHAADRAVADGPLFSDPAEFLRAAHKRWARNKLPGSEPPTKEVAAVGRLPADRVAGVPAPVALADVAAVIDVRYPAMRAVQKARHRTAAKVPPTTAAVKLLVVTLSAVKCTEFGRLLRPLTAAGVEPPPAVAKLFSKHIKMEENVAMLQAAAASSLGHVPLAVGTPARVLALLDAGALALLRSTLVVVDVSRDIKQRMVVDSPDTTNEFMCILGRHLVPSGCSLFLFRDRGVETET